MAAAGEPFPRPRPHTRRGRSRLVVAATLAASSLIAPVAALGLPDAGEEQGGLLDTPNAPRAKETTPFGFAPWTYVAGAQFRAGRTPEPGFPEGSPTPTEVDFLDVAMNGEERAFAVGSVDLGDGRRVPVIYRYRRDERGDEVWEEVYRSPADRPGYAARVVWADKHTVIAVGGDGTFPDREKPDGSGYCAEGEADPGEQDSAANGGAGRGRVWVLRDGEPWRELADDEKPPDLRALTALDSYYSANPDTAVSFVVAGGLCQLWHIVGGEFLRSPDGGGFAPPHGIVTAPPKDPPPFEPVDPDAPTTIFGEVLSTHKQVQERPAFRLRVRDVSFADTRVVPLNSRLIRIGAVTSGCCVPGHDQQRTNVLMLRYSLPADPESEPWRGEWRVDREVLDKTLSPSDADPLGLPDSVYTFAYTQRQPTAAAPTSGVAWYMANLHSSAREPDGEVDREPPSRWATVANDEGGITTVRADEYPQVHSLSSMRLVDADGNADTRQFLDWGVGTLRSSSQGVILSTNSQQVPPPNGPVDTQNPCGTNADLECADRLRNWEPTSTERIDASRRSYQLLKAPVYGLNALDVWDEEGIGWAVGRYGAILRYSDGSSELGDPAGLEPGPPEVGRAAETSFAGGGLYDPFRTLAPHAGGEVPPLAARPRVHLERPRLIARTPTPASLSEVVLSEDGSEGWGIGGSGPGRVLMHYRDSEWRPCHPEAIDTRFEADPHCENLPIREIRFFARVPGDDGKFRAVAVATNPNRFFLYEDGAWRPHPDQPPTEVWGTFQKVVFTSAGEAWVQSGNGIDRDQLFMHYDASDEGSKWTVCTEPPPIGTGVRKLAVHCGDDEGRLDFGYVYPAVGEAPAAAGGLAFFSVPSPRIEGMTAVGGRPYLYGSRVSRRGFRYPWIAVYDGERWTADPELGGLDPGCPRLENRVCQDPVETEPKDMGQVTALELDAGDGLRAWAFGSFVEQYVRPASADTGTTARYTASRYAAARLVDGEWQPLADAGALRDYSVGALTGRSASTGGDDVVLARNSRLLRFEPGRDRFELVHAGRRPFTDWASQPDGTIRTLAGARGGAWAMVESQLFEYTDSPHAEVFEEVPHVMRDARVTGSAVGPDGSLWVSTASERVYRYDRLTGWEDLRISGWNAGKVVTARWPAYAIAIGAGGEGVLVGARGRIAQISDRSATLDPAVRSVCDIEAPVPPCGTGRHLRAAAVAPDGSAMVGGERRALLWRPAGGEFRAIRTPPVIARVAFTGVSMPAPDTAWLGTSDGKIFAGTREGETWSWIEEARDSERRRIMIDRSLVRAGVNAIAVRPDGSGVAVGERGVIVERTPAGVWQRVESPMAVGLLSLALGEDGSAIAGGPGGLVLTRAGGRWQVARYPGWGLGRGPAGDTAGVALAGTPGGGTEAWALTNNGSLNRVWRYGDSAHTAATPAAALRPLPDAPARRPGELALAAWGKTECHNRQEGAPYCREMNATDSYYETIVQRIVEAIAAAREGGAVDAALFTGDAVDNATHQGNHATGEPASVLGLGPPLNGRKKMSRWREMVADRLDDADVPFLQGIGGGDLAANQVCDAVNCTSASRFAHAGENFLWRSVFRGRLGTGPAGPASAEHEGLRYRQLSRLEGTRAEDTQAPGVEDPLPTGGGADTHFAVEVEDASGGEPLLRIVFADTSMGSLSASDPIQQPLEPSGGQVLWLERVLCMAPGRASDGADCTRRPGQPTVVVTNTPTYSYGAGTLGTQPDGAAFEELMLRHRVTAVVSGRLGWNGLYWTLAPALHSPCPGGTHPSGPPDAARPCGDDQPGGGDLPGTEPLSQALEAAGAPAPGEPPPPPEGFDQSDVVTGQHGPPYPTIVASGGGGKFASEAQAEGTAADGFWHGYSLVRVAASGDPGETVVEQRPVYDFVTIEAVERKLRPGQRMTLRGWGRGPVGYSEQAAEYLARWDRIDSAAVTHRYDLVLADPERPHLPLEDANGDYVPVPAQVATVDRRTGVVRARRGERERTYAIGILSVGEQVAGYPLAFEPRRSFAAQRAKVALPPLARPARAPAAQPPLRAAEPAPPPPPPAAAAPASPLTAQTLQPPQPPQLPALPAAQAPPAPQPPAPPAVPPAPAPPAPPSLPPQPQPQPLALGAKLQAVSIVPSVNPPAPPPVNPAPPAGSAARKEAKQRQAATAKSEEGTGTGADADAQADVNTVTDPSQTMTRHAAESGQHAFTRLEQRPGPSLAVRASVYTAGLGLVALLLATAWGAGRPTPRGRRRGLPAAAPATVTRRRW